MKGAIEKDVFLEGVSRILEIPSMNIEDDCHAAPMWGSLACFALKLWFKREYGADVPFAEIDASRSAGELMETVKCRQTS